MTETRVNGDLGGEWGGYQLVAELGHGGMADVFLVVMRGLHGFSKLQVLKRLRASLADDPEFVAMLVEEARLAARLNHPNIVQTNSAGEYNGRPFLTMEYLDGQPLHRLLRRARTDNANVLAQTTLYGVIADVLGGLHHAHELTDFDGSPLRVVHRDVSPQNVFVTYDGQVKVVDFGIAKAAGRMTENTRAGVIKGKLAYMSPEQARGAEVDRRTDVFAVGVMLWEIATGARMWHGLDDFGILNRLLSGEVPRSPIVLAPDTPPEIDAICQRALAVRPEDRYATAADMQSDLEAFLAKIRARLPLPRLGAQVATLFHKERAEARALVEARLSAITIGGVPPPMNASECAPLAAEDATKDVLSGVSTGRRDVPREAPHRARTTAAVAAVAAVLGIVGLSIARRPAVTATAHAETTQVIAPSAPEEVKLVLVAEPATASFVIDDGKPLTNPAMVAFPRDGRAHRLVISAPGYEPVTRERVFEANERLEFALTVTPSAGGGSPTVVAPSAAAASASSLSKGREAAAPSATQGPFMTITRGTPSRGHTLVKLDDDPYGDQKARRDRAP
jgi:serine/threonine-protein kinase